ncbi:hypothetical protein [Enterococcus termitis]|uniref:Glycosyltransferase RgtA/B/C/D-like domain-containing protein n=1 Tax=Enterococcus termitis TaxID=332950 RepID=A0A1E5GV83_9ENTE|nr:hypothetical protein [Enterococcus termitis]OEG16603.1 hypothetical protein BCR25_03110 [Enterococcus termitis]
MNKRMEVIEKEKIFVWGIVSVILLMAFSKNSPIYLTNNWVDANAFMTMGKGMMQGLVPYKDLFEQKGPLLYLIYGLSSLINSKEFTGIYIVECIGMTINLVFCFKILKLYLSEKSSFLLTLFFPVLLLNDQFFRQGGSAEELSIPLLMLLLYSVMKTIKISSESLHFSKWIYLWQGLSVSMIFFIKFTLLGPWVGFYLFIFIYLIVKKETKELATLIVYSAIGLFIGILPWLSYFLLNDAIADFFNVYLFINSNAYNASSVNLIERFSFILQVVIENMKENWITLLLVFPGWVIIPVFQEISKKSSHRLFLFVISLSTLFFTYIGMKSYEYYFLFFMPFGVVGLVMLGKISSFLINEAKRILDFKSTILFPWAFIVSFLLIFGYNGNLQESLYFPNNSTFGTKGTEEKRTAQKLFAEYMLMEKTNPTLLNFGFLDGGFYLAADILPSEYYFELQNLEYSVFPDNYDGQIQAIEEGRVDFVVVETDPKQQEEYFDQLGLTENYQAVMTHNQTCDERERMYWLFEQKR